MAPLALSVARCWDNPPNRFCLQRTSALGRRHSTPVAALQATGVFRFRKSLLRKGVNYFRKKVKVLLL